jgi:hypothetical protein
MRSSTVIVSDQLDLIFSVHLSVTKKTSPALQISLELCIPEKELAITRSQNTFIYFQSHSWYSAGNYKITKGIMKTRFEPMLPRMSSWKNLHSWELNLGLLYKKQVFCHWTIKADTKGSHISILVSFRTTKDSVLPVTFTDLEICSLNWDFHMNSFVGMLSILLWWSNVKILTNVAGILGEILNIFSSWHPGETGFKSGFHSSFWDFICRIWKWVMASSFWDHVIQISIRQVHFQVNIPNCE